MKLPGEMGTSFMPMELVIGSAAKAVEVRKRARRGFRVEAKCGAIGFMICEGEAEMCLCDERAAMAAKALTGHGVHGSFFCG